MAVWRGRDDERLAAAAVLADWALTVFVYKVRDEMQWGVLAVDTGQFLVLLWIAMRSRRYWPLFMGGFALLQVVTHLARMLDPGVTGWSYITAGVFWSYLLLFTIGYGAWTAPYRTPPTSLGRPH